MELKIRNGLNIIELEKHLHCSQRENLLTDFPLLIFIYLIIKVNVNFHNLPHLMLSPYFF